MTPYLPARPCAHPGCGKAVRVGVYCQRHQHDGTKYTHTADGRDRDHVRRLYGTSEWRLLRARVLRECPTCEDCHKKEARTPHHIVPVASGGGLFDRANLVALCESCHQLRHKQLDNV